MTALRRRLLGCAAVAATGAVLLATAAAAQAQVPEKVGNGIKTGQMSVQLFNYGAFISNGGNQGAASPITIDRAECLNSAPPATRDTDDCRWYRLELLFAFLRSKGVTSVELFGHAAFPSNSETEDPSVNPFGLKAYRALLDKYGLHAGGWHGSMNEAGWDARVNAAKILGADYIGSGGVADPGIATYDAVLRSAQALNRLGKKSVEAGVGPAYIHNHTEEFDRKYVDDGVEKYTYDILMERTDPRYVVGELDVFWSSDAFNDVTGTASAAFIDKWGSRIQMLHIKDGINIPGQPSPTNSRSGSPRATGTGELDFRPIFASAVDRVRYYHQEHDGGTLTDADISLTNLKGTGPASVGTLHAKPPSFTSVPAGTAAANNVTPVLVQNTGDQPLNITAVSVQANGAPNDAGDFSIVSQNCTPAAGGGPLSPGNPNATPPLPRGACVVNVGFKPTKTNYTSVARLQFTSNSDNATESVLLAARSTGDAIGTVGGDVPSVLQLNIANNGGSFGTFTPGVGATYTTALAASATTTTGDAALSVTDPSTTASGHLVNGSFSLPQALGVRALGLGDPNTTPYSEAAGTPVVLKSWSSPITAAPLTLGFRQVIGSTDVLRAGTYSKTLTFTLSTTTP
jgi:sugar phosphate isomerase/epimerase